jgi:hypothetical protein
LEGLSKTIGIVEVPVEIRNEHLPNKNLTRHRFSQLAQCIQSPFLGTSRHVPRTTCFNNNSAVCIYVFRMILTVNSDYFLKQR